jgi:hypothetical protein
MTRHFVPERRFFTVSPDLETAAGYENRAGAEAAALAFGDGAHVIDTMSQPYQPAVREVAGGELRYVGYGSFDRRDGLEANIIEAAKKGYAPIVRAFLEKGADVNAAADNGATALHWAAAKGGVDVVGVLLKAGADARRADGNGLTALMLAEKKGHGEVAELIGKALRGHEGS